MTKAQERRLLVTMINTFGKNSYVGPWLTACLPSILWSIANDHPIIVTEHDQQEEPCLPVNTVTLQ